MVVGMQNLSSTKSSSNSITICSEIKNKCHHKINSKLRIVKSCSNSGKKVYGCSLWSVSGKFFVFCLTRIIRES